MSENNKEIKKETEEDRLEREFQEKLAELKKRDPFTYKNF
jgi:hypothetical protein|tara:strand:+ start:327 stop:446 length:120 start_codon:yes stop_codon:yes gene_type:complete